VQAAVIAEKVEGYCHAKLSAVRIAGEVKHGPADSAALTAMRRASSRVSASTKEPQAAKPLGVRRSSNLGFGPSSGGCRGDGEPPGHA
jgi:hypothetical protein